MKPELLANELRDMIRQTKDGRLNWNVEVDTTDAIPIEEKVHVQEEGRDWIVDECFTSFSCTYQKQEFCLITYEIVKKSGETVHSTNMAFLPPTFQRVFDLNLLVAHTIDLDRTLALCIHELWECIYNEHKNGNPKIRLKVTDAKESSQHARPA
ncbi:MAG: hypothetical protein ACI4HI_17570 [Lachnospiraceae bacterium]